MADNFGKNNNLPSDEQKPETRFIDPLAILGQLEIEKGIKVADFGCGTGYFSLPIARKIGDEGVVHALDILPEKLEVVESQAKIGGITNIVTKRVNLENKEGSRLEGESMDWVIMKDVLFQNQKGKGQMLEEAKRVLRPGGKVLLIEWKKEDTTIGPDNKIRISKEEILKLVKESGLGISKEVEAGNFHYCLILIK